jgi:hypothetical protein
MDKDLKNPGMPGMAEVSVIALAKRYGSDPR